MKESSRNRLIIMAHPDDPELACGGSIAYWAEKDYVYYVIVSCGEKGSWEKNASPLLVAERREHEAKKAARYLGVKKVVFLRHPDGEIANMKTLKLEIAALIRRFRPYTIVTHDPWSRYFHPDHRATAYAVIEGIMIARDWHFYPFLLEIGLKPSRPRELLLGITEQPNHVIDITNTYRKKIKAISIHRSQLRQLPGWQKRVRERVKNDGALAGYEYGEGFYRMRI
jgi:LmbE family N-acetylglucosaminyl deacetylase